MVEMTLVGLLSFVLSLYCLPLMGLCLAFKTLFDLIIIVTIFD